MRRYTPAYFRRRILLSNYKEVSHWLLPFYSSKERCFLVRKAIKSTITSDQIINASILSIYQALTIGTLPISILSFLSSLITTSKVLEISAVTSKKELDSVMRSPSFYFLRKHKKYLKVINPFTYSILNAMLEARKAVYLPLPWQEGLIRRGGCYFFLYNSFWNGRAHFLVSYVLNAIEEGNLMREIEMKIFEMINRRRWKEKGMLRLSYQLFHDEEDACEDYFGYRLFKLAEKYAQRHFDDVTMRKTFMREIIKEIAAIFSEGRKDVILWSIFWRAKQNVMQEK